MQLKHKIAALSILPLLLAVAVVCALVIVQNQRLGEQQAQLIEASILASKQAERTGRPGPLEHDGSERPARDPGADAQRADR